MKSTINRRKALKFMGLGMLGTCMPQLPAIAKDKKEKKDKKIKRLIFYFSATGNSKLIASYLSKSLQLSALDMNQHDITDFTSDNVVGLIFPVHAWGMPSVIKKYLPKIIPSLKRASYIFVI